MITKFDTRGNLKSDRTIVEIDILEFGEHFVQSFGKDSTRTEIFNNFLSFIESIKKQGLKKFKIWIDGSFISNKPNPNDLDFLLLVENDLEQLITEILKGKKFDNKLTKKNLKLDFYVLVTEGASNYKANYAY